MKNAKKITFLQIQQCHILIYSNRTMSTVGKLQNRLFGLSFVTESSKGVPGTFAVASLHMRANLVLCLFPNKPLKMLQYGKNYSKLLYP